MKLKMGKANYVLGILGILGGALIIWLAFVQKLAFTKKGFPGPGFFPIMCGIAIVLCSILLMLENRSQAKKEASAAAEKKELEKNIINHTELKNFAVTIGVSWAVVLATRFIGLLPAISIAVIVLLRVLGKEKYKLSVLVGAGTYVALFLIFDMFLHVPLPLGMLLS